MNMHVNKRSSEEIKLSWNKMAVDCAPTAGFGVSDVIPQGFPIGGLEKQEAML
jgi:hypothetical protein